MLEYNPRQHSSIDLYRSLRNAGNRLRSSYTSLSSQDGYLVCSATLITALTAAALALLAIYALANNK